MNITSDLLTKWGSHLLTEEGKSKIDSRLALLQIGFPTIIEVMRETWFIVPAINIVLLVAPILFSFYFPAIELDSFALATLQILNVLLFLITCVYFLRSSRRRWSLNKILKFIANPTTDNQVFFLLGEVCQTGSEKGNYEINQDRSKPEKYILKMIIELFDILGFWEDC